MNAASRAAASFRDPRGRVWRVGRRVLRALSEAGRADFEAARGAGLVGRLEERGWLIPSQVRPAGEFPAIQPVPALLLEHPEITFVSHPYEWSFEQLRRAALLTLDLHLEAVAAGFNLVDSSAYNVQFRGAQPVFIDVLSLRPRAAGEPWWGHRQFCEQFLNPLLLQSLLGVSFQPWYRGSPEGLPVEALARLLPWHRRLSPNVLMHVVLQARLQRGARQRSTSDLTRLRRRQVSPAALAGMLDGMRRWVARLSRGGPPTPWEAYDREVPYSQPEERAKRAFVAEFTRAARPAQLWDLGCNTGVYAELALAEGAAEVIGFDGDEGAIEAAFRRAEARRLAFLPLLIDLTDPSPDQGWRQAERAGLGARQSADALLALALVHHLALGRNVPLPEALAWLVSLAPRGVIEFVPKADATVQRMLAVREDVFGDYDRESFERALRRCARVERSAVVSASGRELFHYETAA